jgi:hypothetical protein
MVKESSRSVTELNAIVCTLAFHAKNSFFGKKFKKIQNSSVENIGVNPPPPHPARSERSFVNPPSLTQEKNEKSAALRKNRTHPIRI